MKTEWTIIKIVHRPLCGISRSCRESVDRKTFRWVMASFFSNTITGEATRTNRQRWLILEKSRRKRPINNPEKNVSYTTISVAIVRSSFGTNSNVNWLFSGFERRLGKSTAICQPAYRFRWDGPNWKERLSHRGPQNHRQLVALPSNRPAPWSDTPFDLQRPEYHSIGYFEVMYPI